jgi:hypothetical protein
VTIQQTTALKAILKFSMPKAGEIMVENGSCWVCLACGAKGSSWGIEHEPTCDLVKYWDALRVLEPLTVGVEDETDTPDPTPAPAPDTLDGAASYRLPDGANKDDYQLVPDGEGFGMYVRRKPAPPTTPAKVRRRMQPNRPDNLDTIGPAHQREHDDTGHFCLQFGCQPVPDPAPVGAAPRKTCPYGCSHGPELDAGCLCKCHEPPSNVDGPAEGRRWIVEHVEPENRNKVKFGVQSAWNPLVNGHVEFQWVRELEPITEAQLQSIANRLEGCSVECARRVLRECGLTVEGK